MPKHLLISEPTLDNLEEFLAQHRAIWGDARMEGDGGAGGDGDGDGGAGGDGDGEDGEGEGGEKPPAEPPALVEERNARKAAETILSELLPGKSKAEIRKALKTGGNALDSLRPQKPAPKKDGDGGDGDQPDAEQIRRDAELKANEKANVRIVSAEVRAIAAELFEDPADAPLYLDLSDYDVDDDGNVDTKKIRVDLKALLEKKKHLAKKGTGKPKPDKTQGARADGTRESQTGRRRLASAYADSST